MVKGRLEKSSFEIEDVRSRLMFNRWETSSVDVQGRMLELSTLIEPSIVGEIDKRVSTEIYRHVVVSAIAALQTFHRGTIINIINAGYEFKIRAAENLEKMPPVDALWLFNEKNVTFAAYVAHQAPCNCVKDVMSTLSNLLDCDVKQALTDAIPPNDLRNKVPSPRRIVSDVEQLLNDLSDAFRFRHIFAHEAASTYVIDLHTCQRLLGSVKKWIEAVDAMLWVSAYRNLPLTQEETAQYVEAKLVATRTKLANVMRQAMSNARKKGHAAWLRSNHFSWRGVIFDWRKNTYGSLGVPMGATFGDIDVISAFNARIDQVSQWVNAGKVI